jgi:hypothetical protein
MSVTTEREIEEGVAAWQAGRREWPKGHPEPEIPLMRLKRGDPRIPRSPRLLLEDAERWGWSVVPTYCRGTKIGAHGRPGKVVDSLALRCRRGAWYVVLVWHDGGTVGGFVRPPGELPRAVNLTDGRSVLASVAT